MIKEIELPLQLIAAERTVVAEIMSSGSVTVHSEANPDGLVERFREEDIRRAPVVDARGQLIGMVSMTNLVADRAGRVTDRIRDIMTPIAFTANPTTTLGDGSG